MQCEIHNVPMQQKWRKDDVNKTGESWYAHKNEDNSWCNGKAKGDGKSRAGLESELLTKIYTTLEKVDKNVQWLIRNNPKFNAED